MPEKINKMPELYMIFARKIFFPGFWGQVPPAPVSYAYDSRYAASLSVVTVVQSNDIYRPSHSVSK